MTRPRAISLAVTLLLVACASSEEKIKKRFVEWRTACGYPTGQERITEAEAQELRACIFAMEEAYRAERAERQQRGLAMLGYGSAMMGTPPAAAPAPRNCTTSITPGSLGRSATTTCH